MVFGVIILFGILLLLTFAIAVYREPDPKKNRPREPRDRAYGSPYLFPDITNSTQIATDDHDRHRHHPDGGGTPDTHHHHGSHDHGHHHHHADPGSFDSGHHGHSDSGGGGGFDSGSCGDSGGHSGH